MHTIDRYIIRLFLANYFILLVVLVSLVVLVDMISGIDEFVQAGQHWAHRYGGFLPAFLWSIFDYYGPIVLNLSILVTGLVVVGAAGFTLSAMARQRELVAIITSGISLYRVAAPLLVVGAALNLLSLPIQEYLIPPLASRLARDKTDLKKDVPQGAAIRYARDSQDNLLSASQFVAGAERAILRNVTILQRDDRSRTVRRIRAVEAVWDPAANAWRLINGNAVRPIMEGQAALVGGLPEPEPVESFPTDLTPQVIMARRISAYPRLIGIAELLKLAQNPATNQRMLIHILHTRFSSIIVNILILMMGLVFFLVRQPNDLMQRTLQAAAVCIVAWAIGLVLSFYGLPSLNPVASAWLPVVLLLPIAAGMLQVVRS